MPVHAKHFIIFVIFVSSFFLLFVITIVKGSTMPLATSEDKVIANPQYPEIKPRTPPQEPRAYLYWYGQIQGLSMSELKKLDYIMGQESQYCDPYWLQNSVSSAAGCFGIVRGTWLESSEYPWSDRYDNIKNIQTAIRIYKRSGFRPWAASL